ncbi:CARDB domain-containing protein, partial [Chitinimonas koreensis]|uniref:CARDB domain-containing protein n=1 Tax=Chitinimonas koreensis TaxID=356302 RepID=UPI00068787D5
RDDAQYVVADHDGDGRSDIAASWLEEDGRRMIGVWFSDGASFDGRIDSRPETRFLDCDFNGDGRRDLLEISAGELGRTVVRQWLAADGGYALGAVQALGPWMPNNQYLVGDLDGDGRDELLEIGRQPDGSTAAIGWKSSENGFAVLGSTSLGKPSPNVRYRLADTTGDGKADLVVEAWGDDGNTYFSVYQGDGRQFAWKSQTGWSGQYGEAQVRILDVNGDGRQDILRISSNVALSYGPDAAMFQFMAGQADGRLSVSYQAAGNWNQSVAYLVGNADGDRRLDVLRVWKDAAGQLQLTLYGGRNSDNAYADDWGTTALGAPKGSDRFFAGDLDGDGGSDLLQLWTNAEGLAVATAWLVGADGRSYAQAGDTVLGAEQPGQQIVLADFGKTGRSDLIRSWQDAAGLVHIEVWRFAGGVAARLASQTAPGGSAPDPRKPALQEIPASLPGGSDSGPYIGSGEILPFPDLEAGNFRIEPAGPWTPGQQLTVRWTTTNIGGRPADPRWSERLEVRNLSTGAVISVATVEVSAEAGDAALQPGASRERVATLAWPDGIDAIGDIQFKLMLDSARELAEFNQLGTGESNNQLTRNVPVGPDLRVAGLRVAPGTATAGEQLAILWDVRNDGAVAVPVGWSDRVVVINRATGEKLVDVVLPYDPAQAGNGPLEAGGSRARAYAFRLPDGLRGTGPLQIVVTADEAASGGVLFEANLSNDAEANNAAAIETTAAAQTYADLRIENLVAPAAGLGTLPVTLSWTVANRGQRDAAGGWDDQIVLSTDAVIGNSDDVVIGTVRREGGLAVGQQYVQSATVVLPWRPAGRYYLGVRTDAGGAVLEPDTRADNAGAAHAIELGDAYADLAVGEVTVPAQALSGENVAVSWTVSNLGNVATDLALWNDRVILSKDRTPSVDDIVLSGSVTHAGVLAPGASYTARATLTLPRDLEGDYYLLVDANTNRGVAEGGQTGNNLGTSTATLRVGLAPVADLVASGVTGPTLLRPGEAATVRYTVSNRGAAAAGGAWRDRIYIDHGAAGLYELANVFATDGLAAGASAERSASFALPSWLAEGDGYRWVVRVDSDDMVYERSGEEDNLAVSAEPVRVSKPDLAIGALQGPSMVRSGDRVRLEWTVENRGNVAPGNWIDRVYLVCGNEMRQLAEVGHAGPLDTGASYAAAAEFDIPLDCDGEYQLVVIADAGQTLDERERDGNRAGKALAVELAPYADLAVSAVTAPERTIADPAPLALSWTVKNQGTGIGKTTGWSDWVILSTDGVLGNGDDRVVGEYRHDGALAAGEQYIRNETIMLPPGTSGRYQLFVVSDARGEVYEHGGEADNAANAGHAVDVMPIAYADLQVEAVTIAGTPASGRSLRIDWSVLNDGIGITNAGSWSDYVWLSRNADGSDKVADLGWAGHIGQLAAGDRYARSLGVTLPEGIEGTFYIHVRTGTQGGLYEFVYGDNNVGHSLAIPVTLSRSPDLVVETITLPQTAQEGVTVELGWEVSNRGEARAEGIWTDTVLLIPSNGGAAVTLGSFSYDRGLEPGLRYQRTEQVRLPAKIEGLYRIKVITNAGGQLYEHGAARNNDELLSDAGIAVSLDARPDLRIDAATVTAEHVTAGTSIGLHYTVTNSGPAVAGGRWKDRVYLSHDGTLGGDDLLVGQYDNGGALAPTESYANEAALVDIPIRYRGEAYLIVVADGGNAVDEYPSESNNARAVKFYVDPVPFADLVTGNVVAPDQAVHGASIEVRYQVSNRGSAATRAESATVSGWTDTIWLARDKRRPGQAGDILLGTVRHDGHLAVGADYLGTAQVTIPDGVLSGNYYLTVWSDAYDTILEDTLASNLNPDDPGQLDNNNYKARPIAILGATPPDLAVTEVGAPAVGEAGGSYSFSYTVQNKGDAFEGQWTDTVYLADDPDLDKAKEVWVLGSYSQARALGQGERYTVAQTVQLAPSLKGRYLVVRTDADRQVKEGVEDNNARSAATQVATRAADLQVAGVVAEPRVDSGEETTVSWTVVNQDAAVWAGSRSWYDAVYFSRDPQFIPNRATLVGMVSHGNAGGLASGASYTASAKVRLPAGIEGTGYFYVITDAEPGEYRAKGEYLNGGSNSYLRDDFYPSSVFEGSNGGNNLGRGTLEVVYREPDLQIDTITVSDPNPGSGQRITVSWTVTNRGTRETRTSGWQDGVYLSRDASLDSGDYALVDSPLGVQRVQLTENGQPKTLKPGESYTASATFALPESISGDFRIIVKADTDTIRELQNRVPGNIREGLPALTGSGAGGVLEFRDEGNNVASIALPITLRTPPDLQVSAVALGQQHVLAGQGFTVDYTVTNAGGDVPSDQRRWNDLVYLSKDRFLDLNQDRYLGYVAYDGGLAAGQSYSGSLAVTSPRDLEGSYYVFVITDPARSWDRDGEVREFGREQNNALAAEQPIVVDTPPPADLKVNTVSVPASGTVGSEVEIGYTIVNDSTNPAYGGWTDAIYLSSDNAWDLGDILLGRVDHAGGLAAGAAYSGSLKAKLPPLKDGNWRIIVRPDLYNEVFEGKISYTANGLNLPPGEANNRTASGDSLAVTVPQLAVASPLPITLSAGETRLYKISVAAGETLRIKLDSSVNEGANEVYVRYGDVPTGYAFDVAYDNPLSPDQQLLVPSTKAGDYYVLVRAKQGGTNVPATLRADLLP